MPAPIRVLVVDDSPSVCRLLAAYLRGEPGVAVAGVAHTGEQALERVAALRPDVVTLDLEMPGMGGLAALDGILATRPTPVVLLSGVSGEAAARTVEGLNRGAVDFLAKYTPGQDTDPHELRRELVAKVKMAAGVKVIRSLPRPAPRVAAPAAAPVTEVGVGAVVVGASTGGPAAVREFLTVLPRDLPAGVLVVQHLPPRFTRAMALLLAHQTTRAVREAADGDRLGPGVVLVAPGDRHSTLEPGFRVRVGEGPKVNRHRPSIDLAMESAARTLGPRAAGVLLTGMGEDGARGLAAIRAAGGATFAQDEESCVVYGMPQRAAQLGAAAAIDTPAGIAARLAAVLARGGVTC